MALRGPCLDAACISCHVRLRAITSTESARVAKLRRERLEANPIRRRRHELGLIQRQLAERLGVLPGAIEKWERGKCYPHERLSSKLIEVLGFDPTALIRGLPDELRRYRLRQGFSRPQMAERLGIHPGTVWRWETGRRITVQRKSLEKIQEFLAEEAGKPGDST